jgi:hypothetical protein
MLWKYQRITLAQPRSTGDGHQGAERRDAIQNGYAARKADALRALAALLIEEKDPDWRERAGKLSTFASSVTWNEAWGRAPETPRRVAEAISGKVNDFLSDVASQHPLLGVGSHTNAPQVIRRSEFPSAKEREN